MAQSQQTGDLPGSGPDAPVQAGLGYVFFIAFIAAAGGFIWGYDIVIMSSAIVYLQPHFELSEFWKGWAMVSTTVGILVGVGIGGWLADAIGRRMSLIIAAILFAVSALGTAFPKTFVDWNVYRIIGGVGAGLAMMVSPMYIAEISPARRRGTLVTLNQLAIVLGAFLSAVAAYYISIWTDESNATAWRWMLGSECVPIIPFVIGLLFVPRSPRWLMQQNRLEEARAVLTRIDGPEHADRELNEINESLTAETGRFSELLEPGVRIALVIAVALAAYQQLCGQSSMIFYAPDLFVGAGEESKTAAIKSTVILRIWNTACTIFALMMVDRLGRRPLLLWGVTGMALAHFIYGFLFQFMDQYDLSPKSLLFAMFLGEAAYTVGLAPLGWLIMSEVFPTRIRARGMMVAVLVLQVMAGLVNWAFPVVKDRFSGLGLNGGIFWIFSFVCLTAILFIYKMVPETKGKSLEEIAKFWTANRET